MGAISLPDQLRIQGTHQSPNAGGWDGRWSPYGSQFNVDTGRREQGSYQSLGELLGVRALSGACSTICPIFLPSPHTIPGLL